MNTYNLFDNGPSPEGKTLDEIYNELVGRTANYYSKLSPAQKEYVDARSAINILHGHVTFYEKHPTEYWKAEGKAKCLERIAMHQETIKTLIGNEL